MDRDSIVDAVRRTREALYEESGCDLRRFLYRVRELERRAGSRVVTLSQVDARRTLQALQKQSPPVASAG